MWEKLTQVTEQLFSNILVVNCHYIRNSLYYAPCIVHPLLKNCDFLNEWNTLLSDLVILPDELLLCGDLKITLFNSFNHLIPVV